MVQNDHPQSNPPQSNLGVIETLKAATRKVGQSALRDEQSNSSVATSQVAPTARREPAGQKLQSIPASANFTEAFVGKITAIEQENAAVEKEQVAVQQELDRILKLQSDLTERKKQLEHKRSELITIKDKITALDKELSKALKLPSL